MFPLSAAVFVAAGTAGLAVPKKAVAGDFPAAAALYEFAAAEPQALQHKRRIERAIILRKEFLAIFPLALPAINPSTGEIIEAAPEQQQLLLQHQMQQEEDEQQMVVLQQRKSDGPTDSLAAMLVLKLEVLGMQLRVLQRDISVIGKP